MKGNLLVSENPLVVNGKVQIKFKDPETAYVDKSRVVGRNHYDLLFKIGKVLESKYQIDQLKFFSKTRGVFLFEDDLYVVDGVSIKLVNKTTAIVNGEKVTGEDRQDLLIKIGNILSEEYGVKGMKIFTFYDSVKELR